MTLSVSRCCLLAKHPQHYHTDNLMEALKVLDGRSELTDRIQAEIEKRAKQQRVFAPGITKNSIDH